jgi:DNA primase catalytic core
MKHKDLIKAANVIHDGRKFSPYWHRKTSTWRITLPGAAGLESKKSFLADMRANVAAATGEAPSSDDMESTDNQKLYDIMEAATEFYNKNLMWANNDPKKQAQSDEAKKYLVSRGFEPDVAKQLVNNFQLGAAFGIDAAGYKSLHDYLRSKGFSTSEIQESGLVGISGSKGVGNIYDVMATANTRKGARIIFPIKDLDGRTVGFTGRSTNAEETLKHILTKTSPIFTKAQVMFGLYQAKDAIAESNKMYVVEGQMDVLAMHAAGIKNTVAASGTGFNPSHIALFESLTDPDKVREIVFAFDPDQAGEQAALSAYKLLEGTGIQASILANESGLDPADIYAKNNVDGLVTLRDNQAPGIIDYFISKAFTEAAYQSGDLKGSAGRLFNFIAMISSPSVRDEYIKLYAEYLGMSASEMKNIIDSIIEGDSPSVTEKPIEKKINRPAVSNEDSNRISADDIEEIRRLANIVDIIGRYVDLKRSGPNSYMGLCPFHDEKTPSFNVRLREGTYYCFSEQEGGDIFKFIQRIENLSFPEAVRFLANILGYSL